LSVLLKAACLLLGVAVALGALAVHRSTAPFGLVLAVGTTYVVAWWLATRTPVGTVLYVAGWLGVLGMALAGRPEGDYVIASDVRGWSMIVAGLGLVVVALVSLAVRRDHAA
jgi:hypothetical protein